MSLETFYSHGKLLITGEYLVLNGAEAFSIPTKNGQKMEVSHFYESKKSVINWKAFDYKNKEWFTAKIDYKNWQILTDKNKYSEKLLEILKVCNNLSNYFNTNLHEIYINTFLEFPNNWGLGSSSTLINNLAEWLLVDAYDLLFKTLGGSGYDIAAAKNNKPILYQIKNSLPKIKVVEFNPTFHKNLFFIHLNQKSNSSKAIFEFKKNKENHSLATKEISEISKKIYKSNSLQEFSTLLENHENIISKVLNKSTIKKELFVDYKNTIKSLGAWGGDFILVVAENEKELSYFKEKGFATILSYKNMALN